MYQRWYSTIVPTFYYRQKEVRSNSFLVVIALPYFAYELYSTNGTFGDNH